MQSDAIDSSCLIKGPTADVKVQTGYFVDEEELVVRERLVLAQRDSKYDFPRYYDILTNDLVNNSRFSLSKQVALQRLRTRAEKLRHHADVTLKALDAYEALAEKGLVDAGAK